MAFRSVTSTMQTERDQIRRILQLLPVEQSEIMPDDMKQRKGKDHSSSSDPASRDMEEAVSLYLRRATEKFDLSKNVEVWREKKSICFFVTLCGALC